MLEVVPMFIKALGSGLSLGGGEGGSGGVRAAAFLEEGKLVPGRGMDEGRPRSGELRERGVGEGEA